MKKRIFSVLMAACLAVSSLPLPVFAEEAPTYFCGKEAHTHEDSCYSVSLICEEAEHQHGEGCYESGQELTCTLAEAHDHGEDCYTASRRLTCQLQEHTHDIVQCYTSETIETQCGLEAHTHEEACQAAPQTAPEQPEQNSLISADEPMLAAVTTDLSTATAPIIINSSNRADYDGKTLTGSKTLSKDEEVFYSNTLAASYRVGGFLVVDGVDLNLTISGVEISYDTFPSASFLRYISAIQLKNGANLNLTITGTNTLRGHEGGAGINVPSGCSLTIGGSGTLNATGGTLDILGAGGAGGAGIGAIMEYEGGVKLENTVGTIIINSGTITATGAGTNASGGAGIGGTVKGNTGSIAIHGGTVTANGASGAAGIGGGADGYVQSITIDGGTVNASVYDDNRAAAIGAGTAAVTAGTISCGIITISGGTVTAKGNIGYGNRSEFYSGGSVTLSETVLLIDRSERYPSNLTPGSCETFDFKDVTIHDGRRTSGGTAAVTIGGKTFSIPLTVSNYTATLSGKLCAPSLSDQTLTITAGGDTYPVTLGDGPITIGQKLHPVTLLFHDDAITGNISGVTVAASQGGTALNSGTEGIRNLVAGTTLTTQSGVSARMEVWVPAGETTFSVTVPGLNGGEAIEKTVNITGTQSVDIWENQSSFSGAIDLSAGDLLITENQGGTLTVTQNGTVLTTGQSYSNVFQVTGSGGTITVRNTNTDKEVQLQLNSVTITSDTSPICLDGANVSLTLKGDSTLTATTAVSVLDVPNGNEMTIRDAEGEGIQGTLTLNAASGGFGIGGDEANLLRAGITKIQSGQININAPEGTPMHGRITISGGTVVVDGTVSVVRENNLSMFGGTLFQANGGGGITADTGFAKDITGLELTRAVCTVIHLGEENKDKLISVTSIMRGGKTYDYGTQDIKTDSKGDLYLYLACESEVKVTVNGASYTGKTKEHDTDQVLELMKILSLSAEVVSLKDGIAVLDITADIGTKVHYLLSDGQWPNTVAGKQQLQTYEFVEITAAPQQLTYNGGQDFYLNLLAVAPDGSTSDIVAVHLVPPPKPEVTLSGLTLGDKVYDSIAAAHSGTLTATTADGVPVTIDTYDYKWYKVENGTDTALAEAPAAVGSYKLVVSVPESNSDYTGKLEIPFNITNAQLTGAAAAQTGTLTYTGSALTPTVSASATTTDGTDVRFTYSTEENGTYGETVPTFTNAGNYTVWFKANAANHEEASGSFKVVVEKAKNEWTQAPSITGWTYDAYDNAVNAPAATAKFGTEVQFDYRKAGTDTWNANPPTEAGSYELRARVQATDNWEPLEGTIEFTIAKAEVTVPVIFGKDYTGENQTANVPVSLLYTVEENNGGTAVGSYDVVLKLVDSANYQWSAGDTDTVTLTFAIHPKVVKAAVAVTPDEYPYTGSEVIPTTVEVKDGETVIPESEYRVEYSNNINAGTAAVTIRDVTGGNYEVSGRATFTITPRSVTTIVLEKTSYVYSGSAKEPAVTVKDGDTVISETEYTVSYSENVEAGTAAVTVTDKPGGNYAVSGTATFTIKPAQLTDVYVVQEGVFIYNGKPQTVAVRTEGYSVTSRRATFTYSDSQDGTYGAMPQFTNAGAYTVYYKAEAPSHEPIFGSVTVNIGKAALTPSITLASNSKVYDGTRDVTGAGITLSTPVSGETPTATASFAYDSADVATATKVLATGITLDSQWTANYRLAQDKAEVSAAITPKMVTNPTIGWEYTTHVYTGSALMPTATVTWEEGTLPAEVSYTDNTDVGTATATVQARTGSNYTFSPVSATFQITPATLTVTVQDTTMQVGHAIPALTHTISGLATRDPQPGVVIDDSAVDTAKEGTYPISASVQWAAGETCSGNYTIATVPGKLQVVAHLYQITSGAGQTILQGNGGKFTSTAPLVKFDGVYVDNKLVAEDNYTKENGSTVVTFRADYIKTLSLGRHDLMIKATDGDAVATFTVSVPSAASSGDGYDSDSPKTGDTTHNALWLALAGLGLAGLLTTWQGKRYYKKRR